MNNTLQIVAHGDQEIEISRLFNAPRGRVFEALTDPEVVRRWMLAPGSVAMPICEMDARVGGAFRMVWRTALGVDVAVSGTYSEVEPPERLVHTQLLDPDWTGGRTLCTTELFQPGDTTMLRLTVLYPSRTSRDGVFSSGLTDVLATSYERLDAVLDDDGG